MYVLMIAPQPFFQPRGTPFSVLHRLRALSKLGHQVDLVTYHLGQNVHIDGVKIYRSARLPFVKRVAIGPSKTKLFLDVFVLQRVLQLLRKNKYDVIHTHEEAGFIGGWLSRKFNTLHLYDMHSSLPQQLSNFNFTKAKKLIDLFDRFEKKTIAEAHAVITICPELHRYVRSRFPMKFNKLIENVADNSVVFENHIDAGDLKNRYQLNGEPVILYAGTLEPYQGIDLLVESSRAVVNKQPNARFVVVGGKPEQIALNKKKTKQLGVESNFLFTGQRPPEEIPHFMKLASILVSPRLEGNNTPLKIYSYLRSGKPIVATNHLTHTQVLNSEVSVLTDCDPQAFAGGIIRVLTDKRFSQKIVNQAKHLAETEYSYSTYLDKTREVYDYLASLRRQ